MKNIYFYIYYRISTFYLHPYLAGGKGKDNTKGIGGGWAIISLIIAAIVYGILYWIFGIIITKDLLIYIPIISMAVNAYILFKKKGLYLSLDQKFKKEAYFFKIINGWGIFLLFIFLVFIQFIWILDHQDNHPEFEGIIKQLINK